MSKVKLTLFTFPVTFLLVSLVFGSNPLCVNFELTYGDDVIGVIDDPQGEIIYSFEGNESDKIIIRLFSSAALTLTLLDSINNDLAQGININGTDRINYTLPYSGTFNILVNDSTNSTPAEYGLAIEKVNGNTNTTLYVCNSSLMDSILSMSAINSYLIDGNQGNHLLIQINSPDTSFKSRMEFYDPDGELVELEISSGNLARIGIITLQKQGNYTLAVMENGGDYTGHYGLSFQIISSECAQALNCNESIIANISQLAAFNTYTFEASSGDLFIARMNGNNSTIDPRMELYDPDFNLLELETSTESLARIGAMELTQNGSYYLIVSDEKGNNLGDYGLSTYFVDPNCSFPVSCSEDLTDSLIINAEIHAYTFETTEGDDFIIQMNGDTPLFESRMELYSPAGELVDLEVSNGNLARIGAVTATEGKYVLLVMEQNADYTGTYHLSLQYLDSFCTNDLICNQDHTNVLNLPAQLSAFNFILEDNERVIIQMNGLDSNFDPRMELYDPDNVLIDTEIAMGSQARIGPLTAQKTGSYFLVISEHEGDFVGDFGLSVQKLTVDCTLPICNQELNASLENMAEIDAFSFHGNAGTTATIETEALTGGINPMIELYDPDFSLVEMSTDSSFAILNSPLDKTGTYIVLVMDHAGNNVGNYHLNLDGCNLTSITKTDNTFQFKNYPNPFELKTNFSFVIPVSSDIKLDIFHTDFRQIETVVSGRFSPGAHTITWEAPRLPPGIYWCRFQTNNTVFIKKLILY